MALTKVHSRIIDSSILNIDDFGSGNAAITSALAKAKLDSKKVVFNSDTTINVPTNAATLSDVINYVADNNVQITLNIESGTTISEQLVFDRIDYSFIKITSADATVTIDRSALTTGFTYPNFGTNYPFMVGTNGAKLPIIGCLFDMDGSGTNSSRDGIFLVDGASVIVDQGCGVSNAGGQGLLGYGAGESFINGSVWDGAGKDESGNTGRGVWWRYSGFLHANRVSCDDANWTGFQVQSSQFSAANGSATGCGHYSFRARGGASGSAEDWTGDNSAGHGCNINEGSNVSVKGASFQNCGVTDGEPAVLCDGGSCLDLRDTEISGHFNGVIEARGARIDGVPTSIDANVSGGSSNLDLRVTRGGTISGAGFVSAGFTSRSPYNVFTSEGIVTDDDAPTGAATISSGEIDVTHRVTFISQESAILRTVDTINLPIDAPDGTMFVFFAADNAEPITLTPTGGNIFTWNGQDIVIDNSDSPGNYSALFIKRTISSQSRLYEVSAHD